MTLLTHAHGPRAGLNAEPVCPCGTAPDPAATCRCPRSWVPSTGDTTETGIRNVHHQANQAGQDTDDVGYGADQTHGRHGIGGSIRPGTAVPDTVLVADMYGGALLLQGWRDRPTAYLSPSDAGPLRRELVVAFGGSEPRGPRDEGALR
jgi:hypothetical protein